MSVSYEYYKIFYYVARYQSINKAAKVLSNSQPNITRTIKKLEEQLNTELFMRTPKGVALTRDGELLYTYVKAAHKQLTTAENMLLVRGADSSESLSIGISIGISNNIIQNIVLPPIIAFRKDHPDVRIHITNDTSPTLIAGVYDGIYDIVFITSHQSSEEKLKENILYSYRDIVIAGTEYAKNFTAPVSLKELIKYPFIGLSHDSDTFQLYEAFFSDHGLDLHISVEAGTIGQICDFVIGNLGIGCAPADYLQPVVDDGRAVRVELTTPLPIRLISLVRNESRSNSHAAILEGYYLNLEAKAKTVPPLKSSRSA